MINHEARPHSQLLDTSGHQEGTLFGAVVGEAPSGYAFNTGGELYSVTSPPKYVKRESDEYTRYLINKKRFHEALDLRREEIAPSIGKPAIGQIIMVTDGGELRLPNETEVNAQTSTHRLGELALAA